MPTKSNNIGGRGGKRPGAGRKKTAVKDKYENGNPGGRKLEVLDIPDTQGEDMPEPHKFLSARQHDGTTLEAEDIYRETWEWLDKLGVAKAVSPRLLERYAMCSARWIQCEEMTTKIGYLSKHPTTGKPIPRLKIRKRSSLKSMFFIQRIDHTLTIRGKNNASVLPAMTLHPTVCATQEIKSRQVSISLSA